MKGTFFQKPLEFRLEVAGEAWNQGDIVQGSLTIRNHGNVPIPLHDAAVHLAFGDHKKLRQKSADAFQVFHSVENPPGFEIPENGSSAFEWSFQLDRNAPITDAGSSLFLLYGRGGDSPSLGQLQLTVHPEPLIQEFLKILEVEFRFAIKTRKFSKGSVEIKLAAPEGKAFALVEGLILNFQYEGDSLSVRYTFQVKKLEATASGFGAIKQKRELKQVLVPGEHLKAPGKLDQASTEKLIREALAVVESKILF